MHLKEGFLEDIFGRRTIAEEPDEEVEQLALIALDQLREGWFVSVAIGIQELLVGARRRRRGFAVATSLGSFVAILLGMSVRGVQSLFLCFLVVVGFGLRDTHCTTPANQLLSHRSTINQIYYSLPKTRLRH